MPTTSARVSRAVRDHFETELKAHSPDAVIFGAMCARLANTSNFAMPGLTAETVVIALDLDGVMVSSGSACSSGKVAPPMCWPRWAWPKIWRRARCASVSAGIPALDRCRCGDRLARRICVQRVRARAA